MVALTGGPEGETLIRRAGRLLPVGTLSVLSPPRRLAGFTLAVFGLPVMTLLLVTFGELNLTSNVLLFLLAVVAVALAGGCCRQRLRPSAVSCC